MSKDQDSDGQQPEEEQQQKTQKASKVPRVAGKRPKKAPRYICTERMMDAVENGNASIPIPKLKECQASLHRIGRGKIQEKCPSLPLTTIARIMRDAAMNYSDVMRMERKALELAHPIIERKIVEILTEVREAAEHRKRKTVMHEDFQLVMQKYNIRT